MEPITTEIISDFLNRLGERFPNPVTLYLLGGSALVFLGNPRQTLDIDYTTDLNSESEQELESVMTQLAAQYGLDVESVPIAEFVPLPPEAETRRRFIGRFGQIDVYLYDLYTIALSKIARGFDADLEDVVFLIKANLINFVDLQRYFQSILPKVAQVDIVPSEFKRYFDDLMRRLVEK